MLRISHVGGQRGFASRPPEIKSSIINLECKHSIRDYDDFIWELNSYMISQI